MRTSLAAALAIVLTFGCTDQPTTPTALSEAVAGPSFSSSPVPFSIRLTVTGNPPMPPFPGACEAFFTTSVEGNATHLGRVTGIGETCAFNVRVVADPPFVPDGSAPPFFVAEFTNEMWWTAANGDVLHFMTSVPATFVQSLTDGTSRSEGTAEFAGGTGRFEGATGGLTVLALDDQFSAEGWIQYDASKRAN